MRFPMTLRAGLLALLPLAACGREGAPDAYGNFEATEVVVSAETAGQLTLFTPEEGQRIAAGTLVGVIDTLQLVLERDQVLAQRSASTSRAAEAASSIGVLQSQLEIATRNYERTQRLHRSHAATEQQLDQAEREVRTLTGQIEAARSQRTAVQYDAGSSGARIAQIADRIRRSRITSPQGGTVLTTYAEAGEYVQHGQPLYKVALLDSMILRVWITGPQLAQVRLGQQAQVTIDAAPGERRTLAGRVSWISSEAEFTPTPVQTREERADLVYGVKIIVPNGDGVLKIGMPADVRFDTTTVAVR